MTNRSAVKKNDDFPPDSSGRPYAAPVQFPLLRNHTDGLSSSEKT